MHETMKNGGLIENNRQNEHNKLPIFGAHQSDQWMVPYQEEVQSKTS